MKILSINAESCRGWLLMITRSLNDRVFPDELIADLELTLKKELESSTGRMRARVVECIEALNASGLASKYIEV